MGPRHRKRPRGPAEVVDLRPRPGPAPADVRAERFEFADGYRGVMARLTWGRAEVLCTEWPGTLLAMLRAGVLGPEAREEAEILNAVEIEA